MKHNLPTHIYMDHTVTTNEVDMLMNATIPSILNWFQDIATQHADVLGFGYDDFKEKGHIWVLSRIHIELSELPKWKEEVKLKTWTNGVNGIFPNRNWELYMNEQKKISAIADWLVLDFTSRRPLRPDFGDFEDKTEPQLATKNPTIKIAAIDDLQLLDTLRVRLNEIDMHEHVNNVVYFAWIVNALGLEWKKKYYPIEIDINYLKEVRYPAKVEIWANADRSLFSLRSENDNLEYCRMKIEWKQF